MSDSVNTVVDTDKDFGTGGEGIFNKWNSEIFGAEEYFKKWYTRADKIDDIYRADDKKNSQTVRMHTLWSNLETLKPSVFSQNPTMDIQRRYGDKDPVGRVASRMLERALSITIDDTEFDDEMSTSRDDYLLSGRGQTWLLYNSELTFNEKTATNDLASEKVFIDFINRRDFLHTPAERWKDVWWVSRRVHMTFDAVTKRFSKKIAEAIQFGEDNDKNTITKDKRPNDTKRKTQVYEIWDKQKKKIYWFSKSFKSGVLDIKDDFYNLRDFFPCPKPLYATMTSDTLIPVPDYAYYQDLSFELDRTITKISLLTRALRVLGFYDAAKKESLSQLLDGREISNKMVGIEGYADLQAGGASGLVTFMPLREIAETIIQLQNAKAQFKADIAEITGISDIIRGQGKASETATAQRIKGQFATLRLDSRQKDMAVFVRSNLRLMAELIAEQFDSSTLINMTGALQMDEKELQYIEPAIELLKNDVTRTFRIDIETGSTIGADKEAEKASRIEMLTSVGTFLQQSIPLAQQVPELAPLMGELLTFAVRSFDAGRPLEASFEEAVSQLNSANKEAQENPPQEPQDPELVKVQGQIELDNQDAQNKNQLAQQKATNDINIQQQKINNDLATQQQKIEAEGVLKAKELEDNFALQLKSLNDEKDIKMEKVRLDASIKDEGMHLDNEIKEHQSERQEIRKTLESGILDENTGHNTGHNTAHGEDK